MEGKRSVPIELLDVAGLVPGAHEGKGLGNKFLDDLRHADALIHVVDVSGTTDAEGGLARPKVAPLRMSDSTSAQERLQEDMIHHKISYGYGLRLSTGYWVI